MRTVSDENEEGVEKKSEDDLFIRANPVKSNICQ